MLKDKEENDPLPSTTHHISSFASFQTNKDVEGGFTSSTSFSNNTSEAADTNNTTDNEHNSVLADKTTNDTLSNLNKDQILAARVNEWRLLLLERPPSTQEDELNHWLLKVLYFAFQSHNDDFQKHINTMKDDVQQVLSAYLSLHSSSNISPISKSFKKRLRKGKANSSTMEKYAF